MRPGEALGYDDPDPTVELARVPVSLLQDLLMERRKAKVVLVATLIDLWEVSAVKRQDAVGGIHTGTQVDNMRPSRPLAKHGASVMKDLATRQNTEPDNLRNTDPVNKHPDLKEQRIVRLHQALHQTARARHVPAMDRHAERGIVRQAGHEGRENRQLAQVTLGQEVGRRVEDGRAVKVGRFWQRQWRPCCSQDGTNLCLWSRSTGS
jgi:hypothetical protein